MGRGTDKTVGGGKAIRKVYDGTLTAPRLRTKDRYPNGMFPYRSNPRGEGKVDCDRTKQKYKRG